jgi:hypothetical protein
VAVRWLRRADLGTEEIACRTAQNLYSLHRRFARKLMQTFAVAVRVALKQSASVIALEILLLAMALMAIYWADGALDAIN